MQMEGIEELHRTLGLVAMQRAMQARGLDDTERASAYFAESAGHYTRAGMLYPEDDEKRIGALNKAGFFSCDSVKVPENCLQCTYGWPLRLCGIETTHCVTLSLF